MLTRLLDVPLTPVITLGANGKKYVAHYFRAPSIEDPFET